MDLKTRLLIRIGTVIIRLLAGTWRFRVVDSDHITRLRQAGKPFIFSLWHGQLLPLLWHHRNENITILISEHRDGELIARVAESLGCKTVRGSSTRGAERALIGLIRVLKEGREIAVTPDGPRGPACTYAPGALVAAQKSGAPILPIAARANKAWRLGSWDKFMIPKPFAQITVAYGNPELINAASPRDAVEHDTERLQNAMAIAMGKANA
jgi:lysophospholipid acyltransferase (LPLAT)-like uncharacterized protein